MTSLNGAPRKGVSSGAEDRSTSTPERPTTYVVSDVLLYREGLASYLQNNGLLTFIGSGPPTEPTLQTLEHLSPDAVIVDLAMAGAIPFAQRLHDRINRAKTVAFAASDLEKHIVSCAKAGICGYVSKDGTADDIVLTVLHAVKGELHCTPKFACC